MSEITGTARQIGLGTAIRHVTALLHIPHCGGCRRRAETLDRHVQISLRPLRFGQRRSATRSADCWRYVGRCTGFGSRQCVRGPAGQRPDAQMIDQCCNGWFQYPWIEVCPGAQASTGCGFCFW